MRSTRSELWGRRMRRLSAVLLAGWLCASVHGAAATEDMGEIRAAADEAGGEAVIPTVSAAKRLLGVQAERTEGGTILRLRADGRIEGARSMVLEDPTRLVVDLPGLRSAVGAKRIDVDSAEAARVRVGQHDEKVRVVIDGGSASRPFDGHAIVSQADGLAIGLGSEAAVLQGGGASQPAAMAAAPPIEEATAPAIDVAAAPVEAPAMETSPVGAPAIEAAPTADTATAETSEEAAPLGSAATSGSLAAASSTTAPTPAPAGSVRVHGLQFDQQAGRDRLVIVQEGIAEHSILRPDAETLVVSLQGATLDPGANIRITPQQPGPVSLVTAVQMPGSTEPEVRVAIAREAGLEPIVSQEGQFLILDFARSGAAPSAATGTVTGAMRAALAAQKTAPQAPPASAASASGAPSELLQEGGLVGGKNYTGRRISLDFKDVDIADVLRLIAEVSDLNVIAGDEVKGNVTIRLTDVPWDQALDVILLTKGLGFVKVGNVLRIAPSDVLKAEEAARLEERRAKEKLEDLVVKLLPVNYANVAEIETMTKKLLTSRGSVNIDKRTNTLILKDIPSVVDEAVALTKAIDTPTPQVLIDAKIVEAKLDFSRDLGAVWGIGSNPDVDGQDFAPPPYETNGGTTFPFQQPNNVVVSNPITSSANGLLNLGGYILNDRFNLTLQLQAAESEGEGKVISSPRVVTLDNREAKIEQGVSIPFQTFENGDAQLEFIDAVLSLLVTPHITADKSIIMKITVTRNAPDPSVPTPTGSPAIAKNEARTETLVKNGQTLVLGGIYTIDRSDNSTRVPYLYRIPIIGTAFENESIRDKRRELLIFVTPRIVETTSASN